MAQNKLTIGTRIKVSTDHKLMTDNNIDEDEADLFAGKEGKTISEDVGDGYDIELDNGENFFEMPRAILEVI